MELRKMGEQDIDMVSKMIEEYRSDLPGERIVDILQLAISSDSSHALVVSEGSKILGFVHFNIIHFPMIAGKECYMSDLLVSGEERGKGVGSLLMDAAERIAKRMGCKRMMLNNLKEADSYMRGYYSKKGYTEREGVANFVKPIS